VRTGKRNNAQLKTTKLKVLILPYWKDGVYNIDKSINAVKRNNGVRLECQNCSNTNPFLAKKNRVLAKVSRKIAIVKSN